MFPEVEEEYAEKSSATRKTKIFSAALIILLILLSGFASGYISSYYLHSKSGKEPLKEVKEEPKKAGDVWTRSNVTWSWYKMIDGSFTFDNCQKICAEKRSQLVMVDSVEENDFVYGMAKGYKKFESVWLASNSSINKDIQPNKGDCLKIVANKEWEVNVDCKKSKANCICQSFTETKKDAIQYKTAQNELEKTKEFVENLLQKFSSL